MDRAERNRRNAQSSTGPKTAEGRARSAKNAMKHGLSSPELFQTGVMAELFREYYAEFRGEFSSGGEGDDVCRDWIETVLVLQEIRRLRAVSREIADPLIFGFASYSVTPIRGAATIPERMAWRLARDYQALSRYEDRAFARLRRLRASLT